MSVRTRLVLVAAIAVAFAVLAASISSYLAARNSLLNSIDGTLQTTATSILANEGQVDQGSLGQFGFQYLTPAGTILAGGGIPITKASKEVASGRSKSFFTDVTLSGRDYREFVVSAGTLEVAESGNGVFRTRAALQVVLPLGAVDAQLSHLGSILFLVAAIGVALSLALAWLVGRTALIPLNELTASVEQVANTTDMSMRLDPGGTDELGRLRRAFNRLLAALERSREAQRQLVLDAGHELRTPLTSLRTNLEVVRRLDELSPHDRDVLVDDLLTQMEELTTLVADLSELARGEQRHDTPSPLRLDQVVEDAVAVARTHGRPRGIRIQCSTEPNWVNGRRDAILRAVGNLVDNAMKWSPDNGVVEVVCRMGTVSVRDHGPGISAEDALHVFDRFFRAPSARSLPGSGLGLAIVAQVAEAEGGSVKVLHPEGGGAELQLNLPTLEAPVLSGQASTSSIRFPNGSST